MHVDVQYEDGKSNRMGEGGGTERKAMLILFICIHLQKNVFAQRDTYICIQMHQYWHSSDVLVNLCTHSFVLVSQLLPAHCPCLMARLSAEH